LTTYGLLEVATNTADNEAPATPAADSASKPACAAIVSASSSRPGTVREFPGIASRGHASRAASRVSTGRGRYDA